MIILERKRKVLIHALEVSKKYQTFDIPLPANIKKVMGMYINHYAPAGLKARIGTITFQSQDESDIFLSTDLYGDGLMMSDEAIMQVNTGEMEQDFIWIRGRASQKIPLSIAGDTTTINGWFQAAYMIFPYTLHLFLEYEEIDRLKDSDE